jgi:hypothetical protein
MIGRKWLYVALIAVGFAGALCAQTLVLDSFNAGAATGAVVRGSTWVGSVTQNPDSISIGSAARDDNGWGASGQNINATGYSFITISGRIDPGHAATRFTIQLEDRNLNTQVFSIGASAFTTSLSRVQIPLGGWSAGFDATRITGWSIGGGTTGQLAFRMTLDELALTAASVPGAAVAPTVAGSYGASTRAIGDSVTFAVDATGTAPLAYQWFKNGTTPVGNNASATTANLTLSAVTALDSGVYTCTVSNAAGSVVSGAFNLTVTATPATVVLSNLTATYTGAPRLAVATTTPAGLPVVVTYNGSATPPVDAGSYAVVATVNDPNYSGRATGTLVVAKASQSIVFAALPTTLRVGVPFAFNATASSGGPVVITVLRGNATIDGTTVTARDAAEVTLRATQAGDANHLAATSDFLFTTTKQNQSIAFPAPTAPVTSTAPVALNATASSGLLVTYSVISGPARIAGPALVATGPGLAVVRAYQSGSESYNAAPDVERTFTVALPAPPLIVVAPASRSVVTGTELTLNVTAAGDAPLAYRWFKDDVALPGATRAVLAIAAVAATDAGRYSVEVSNVVGAVRSGEAVVTVTAAPAVRLVNLSTRARAGLGEQVVIAGFVVAGTVPKPMLIRAVGPALTAFGVADPLAAPKLELVRDGTVVAANTGWTTGGAAADIAAAAARGGAFALDANSADSALLATLAPGNYTAVISAADGRPGVGLVEVYDLSAEASGPGVSNLSVRALSGADAQTLIVGVVVQGAAPKRLLIRAVGPGLAQFGVSGILERPQLAVFSGQSEIARNAGWSTSLDAAAIAQAATRVGAFPLASASLDSALIVSLAPGAYTAQVSGPAGSTGVALVEVYELP